MSDVKERMARAAADRVLYIPLWRAFAMGFAVIATLWGLLAGILVLVAWPTLLLFGPGYIVTAGYYWRGWRRPTLGWTRAVWAASLVVQGAWVAEMVSVWLAPAAEIPVIASRTTAADWLIPAWWLLTTAVSAAGLLFDRGDESA